MMRIGEPDQPLLRARDAADCEWIESAWRRHEQTLLEVDWSDTVQGGRALLLTAVLRCDVEPTPDAVARWWRTPLAVLRGRSWLERCPRLDPMTRLCIEALSRAAGSNGDRLPGCVDTLVPLLEADLDRLGPPGVGSIWGRACAVVERIRIVYLPPVLRTALALGEPLAPHSRWRCDVGAIPDQGRVGLTGDRASRPGGRAMRADEAVARLVELGRRLRGEDLADIGRNARVSIAEGAALIERYRRQFQWNAFEALVLDWCHRHLLEHDGSVKPQSIARYLSALVPVVLAQGQRPFLALDATSGQWRVDHERWREVAGSLVANKRDDMTVEMLGRWFGAMRKVVPALGDLDLSPLQGHGREQQVAAHMVTPAEFESALTSMYEAGGEYARGSLAAVVMYYAGLRPSEAIGLLASDVLPEGDGVLLLWSHPARRLKTRPRRIRLQGCLPEPWRTRLCDAAAAARMAVDGRGYLFSDLRRPLLAPDKSLLDPVIARLRQVTGDANITSHTLRHSFANLAFARMMLLRVPHLRAYPSRLLDADMFSPAQLQAWSFAWFRGSVPQDGMYELARVLGHSQPARALTSYVHLGDLFARAQLTACLPAPRRRVMAKVLGMDMQAFRRLERGAKARLKRMRLMDDVPASWALVNELERSSFVAAPMLPAIEPTAPVPLAIVDLAHVCAVLQRWELPLEVLAGLMACPVEQLRSLVDGARDAGRWPRFPEPRSRALLEAVACALEPMLASATAREAMLLWRRGLAISRQRRLWTSPGDLPGLARLLAPLAELEACPRFRVFLVVPSTSQDQDGSILQLHQRLTARLRKMRAQALAPKFCTWRDLRLSPRPPSPVRGAAGCHLVIVPGVRSAGRALGSGQAVLAALDAAALLAGVPRPPGPVADPR